MNHRMPGEHHYLGLVLPGMVRREDVQRLQDPSFSFHDSDVVTAAYPKSGVGACVRYVCVVTCRGFRTQSPPSTIQTSSRLPARNQVCVCVVCVCEVCVLQDPSFSFYDFLCLSLTLSLSLSLSLSLCPSLFCLTPSPLLFRIYVDGGPRLAHPSRRRHRDRDARPASEPNPLSRYEHSGGMPCHLGHPMGLAVGGLRVTQFDTPLVPHNGACCAAWELFTRRCSVSSLDPMF